MVSLCPRMKNIKVMVLGLVILFITAAMMFTYPMIHPNPTKQMSVNFKSRISAETNFIEDEPASTKNGATEKDPAQMKVSAEKGQEESKRGLSQDGKQQKSNKNDEEQAGKEPDKDEELTGQEPEKDEEVTGQEPEKDEEVTGQEPEGDKINDEVDDDKNGSDNYYYGESEDPADSEKGETSPGFFGFFDGMANTDWSWLKPFQSSSPFRDPAPAPYDAIFEDEEGYDSGNETETQAKPNKLERSDDNDNSDNEISEKSKNDDDGDKDIEDENKSNDVDNNENPGSVSQASEQGATDEKTDTEEDKKEEQSGDEQTNGEPGKVKPKTQDFKAVPRPQSSNAREKDQSWTARPEQLGEKQLVEIFENKLLNITVKEKQLENTCFDKHTLANSCDNGRCLRTKLPTPPEERVKQLINRPGLILSDSQHAVLREMAAQVTKKYDVILLTTASSNHFLESQALLQNLHKNVFPFLKNFTLLFYDIGLTPLERKEMERFCRCQVLSFPFEKLPKHVQNLKCYAWKPVMIKAHIHQANVVLWLDASIRFNGDPGQLHLLIQRVKDHDIQIGRSGSDTTFRTFRSLFHYFGDEPCMYLGRGQVKATIGGYKNEQFVDRVVLEPWVACALNQDCMCPANNLSAGCRDSKAMDENYRFHGGPIIYGMCHRFDQSAITLILHKLYQGRYLWVMMNVRDHANIARDHQVPYFKTLKT